VPQGRDTPRRHVLVTRPPPGAAETLDAVGDAGFVGIACPVMRIIDLPHDLPPAREAGGVLLTSRQALPALGRGLARDPAWASLPLFAVGDRTAQAARQAGFTNVRSASGDGTALTALVARDLAPRPGAEPCPPRSLPLPREPAPLLLPVGRGQGEALAAALGARGLEVRRVEVYAQQAETALAPPAEQALRARSVAACLFFSGETARLFTSLCRPPLPATLDGVRALAISHAAAEPLAGLRWGSVEIAARPDAASVLALLGPGGRHHSENTP